MRVPGVAWRGVCQVDARLRTRVKAHHTATHLLQSALKIVLGESTSQQGSLCDFERLRWGAGGHG